MLLQLTKYFIRFCFFISFFYPLIRCEEEGNCIGEEEGKPGPAAMDQVSGQSLLVVVQFKRWR